MSDPQTRQRPAATGRWDRKSNTSGSHAITASPAQQLLPRLEGVVTTAKGWRARCPAHGGRSASLAITEGDNSTLLLHCFAGCATHEVLAAVGLQVGDLFVRRDLRTMTPAERGQLRQAALLPRWRAALEVLQHEVNVVLIAATKIADGKALTPEELTRLTIASLRTFDAGEVLHAR
jgi:hypothetical protein